MTFRRLHQQRAFTLIELLVVILVVAVLIAVAAPSFLGQQDKAHDSVAKQYLGVSYRAGKAIYKTDNDGHPATGATGDVAPAETMIAQLARSEPQMRFVDPATGVSALTARQVQVAVAADVDRQVATYTNKSRSGRVFCVQTVEQPVTVGSDSVPAGVYWSSGTGCGTGGGPAVEGDDPLPVPPGPIVTCTDPGVCGDPGGPDPEEPVDPDQEVAGDPDLNWCGPNPTPGKPYADVVEDTSNLRAWWRYESTSTTAVEDSQGNYDGMWLGGGFQVGVPGIAGNAADFGAGDAAVVVPGAQAGGPGLYLHDTFPFRTGPTNKSYYTFETWAYLPYGRPNAGGTVWERASQFSGYGLQVGPDSGSLLGPGGAASGSTSLDKRFDVGYGRWVHVVGTDNEGIRRLYLNGHLVSEHTASDDEGYVGHPFTLGNNSLAGAGSLTNGAPFNGLLDETAFYSRPLTAAEVCHHYRAGMHPYPALPVASDEGDYATAVNADNPVHWWRFDEAEGASTLADEAAVSPVTVPTASRVTLGAKSPVANSTAATLTGSGGNWGFGGYDSALTLPRPFSVELWVKAGAGGEYGGVAGNPARLLTRDGSQNYIVSVRSDGRPELTTNGATNCVARTIINGDRWHHLVAVVDATQARLFVNGVEHCRGRMNPDTHNTPGNAVTYVGQYGGAPMTRASLDELALYRTALPAERIRAHYLSR